MKKTLFLPLLVLCMVSCDRSQTQNDEVMPDKNETREPIVNLEGAKITQIGIVVNNVEETSRNLSKVFGIEDWTYLDLTEEYFEDVVMHDTQKETKTHLRIATADAMGINFELIEPVSGESTHMEFLEKHGEGIHHISIPALTPDQFQMMMQSAQDADIEVEMKAQLGKATTFAYLNMREELGILFEIYTTDPDIQSTITPSGQYHFDGELLLPNREITQLGIVVNDVKETVKNYKDLLGINDWVITDINITDAEFRSKNIGATVSLRAAFANQENMEFELLKQTSGTGTHQDFLTNYGNGIHHILIKEKSGAITYNEDLELLKKEGVNVEMLGHIPTGMFSYLDTRDLLSGVIIETGIPK